MAKHGNGYENTDASMRVVVYFLGSLAVFAVIVQIGLAVGYNLLDKARGPSALSPVAVPHEVPPAPRLQVSPAGELNAYLEEQRQELAGQGSRPRIPIEQAKELVLKAGLGSRPALPPQGGTAAGVLLDSGGASTVLPRGSLRLADPSGFGSAYAGTALSPSMTDSLGKGGSSAQKKHR